MFSELLLGVALKDILLHVGALMKVVTKVCCADVVCVYDQVSHVKVLHVSFVSLQAQVLANRQIGLDCEFVFAALRLLHTLGSSSAEAHGTVMQLRDLWRNIAPKLAAAKRTATYTAEGALQNPPGATSTKSGNGGGNGNKATASAAAFLLN